MGRMKRSKGAAFAALLILFVRAGCAAPARAAAPLPGRQLVILDTDIGDDIDDAFALALALHSPELKLLGITTEFGDTELRARLLDRYLGAVHRGNIPVASGIPTPHTNVFTQAAYARHAPSRPHPAAVSFLLSQIRAHPGQITLICIGPLVNVQSAIARDPAGFRQLKRVVLMGGSIYKGYRDSQGYRGQAAGANPQPPSAEWNVLCDPAGLRALLASGVPVFIMPLDSTQIPLPQPQMAALFAHGSPLTDQLTLLYHQWSGAGPWRTPTLYDPVAVTYAIRPDLCPTQPMRLSVDDRGFTRPEAGAPNANVCLHSDEQAFLRMLSGRITGEAVTADTAPYPVSDHLNSQ